MIRLFELARELGVTSEMILEKCLSENLPVTNRTAVLSRTLRHRIHAWFPNAGVPKTVAEQPTSRPLRPPKPDTRPTAPSPSRIKSQKAEPKPPSAVRQPARRASAVGATSH